MRFRAAMIFLILLGTCSVGYGQRSTKYSAIQDGEVVAFLRRFSLSPTSTGKEFTVTVPLPQSLPHRQEVITTLYSYRPDRKLTDKGQQYAQWKFTNVKKDFELRVIYVVRLFRYDLSVARNRGGSEESTSENLSEYLEDDKYLMIQDSIVQKAAKGIPKGKDDLDTIKNIHDFVTRKLTYRGHTRKNRTAPDAISSGWGKCNDYANSIVALSRASGIPARKVTGYTSAAGDAGHAWAEAYSEQYGWIPFDPTWNDQKGEPCGVLRNAYLLVNRVSRSKIISDASLYRCSSNTGRGGLKHTLEVLFGDDVLTPITAAGKGSASQGQRQLRPLLETTWGWLKKPKIIPGSRTLGSWDRAMGQILYYHRRVPRSKISYKSGKYVVEKNLDSLKFNWDLFVNDIKSNTPKESMDEVYRYMYTVGAVMKRKVGANEYWLSRNERSTAIKRYYRCYTRPYDSRNVPLGRIQDVIREELDSHRPVFLEVASKSPTSYHAAVIDGYRVQDGKFEVHVNIGPRGKGNGYYDFSGPILQYDESTYRFIITVRLPGQYKSRQVDKVKGMLAMARTYLSVGMPDKAKGVLEKIIQKHGESEHARAARKLLKSLVNKAGQ